MIPDTQATIEWNESFCIFYADTGGILPGYKLKRIGLLLGHMGRPDASASNHEAVG